MSAPLDAAAAADRLEAWVDSPDGHPLDVEFADIRALVAGFRAAVERAEAERDRLAGQLADLREKMLGHADSLDPDSFISEVLAGLDEPPREGARPSQTDGTREVDGTPSEAMCECGHPARLHWMASAQPSCRATVYTDAPLGGGSAFPCHCRSFARPEGTPPNTTSNRVGGGA